MEEKVMDIVKQLSEELESIADPKTKETTQRFFKEHHIETHGVKSAVMEKISKEYFKKIKELSKDEIYTICESLWENENFEEKLIACNWSYNVHKQFEEKDIQLFEEWLVKYVDNWATCDTFCNHTVGEFIMMYPQYISTLKKWSKSKNIWLKRASAVSLIIPARKGMFLNDVFEIADTLLLDPNDMVRKGYGWMLKVASQSHQEEVFKYVMDHKTDMPRVSLRYAIEKIPKNLKEEAMKK